MKEYFSKKYEIVNENKFEKKLYKTSGKQKNNLRYQSWGFWRIGGSRRAGWDESFHLRDEINRK